MNEDQLDDLEWFIANTLSQTEVRLTQRTDGLDQHLSTLEHEVGDGFAEVGEVIEQLDQRLDDRDKDVDLLIVKLERRLVA